MMDMGHRGLDRRHWPDHCDRPGTYGVVTAADANHELEVGLLVRSLMRWNVPVHVFDLGLSDPQSLVWEGVTVSAPVPGATPKDVDHWQAWWKPFLIDQSPYDLTLWMDADCVAVESPSPLFALLTEVPVLTTDHYRPDLCHNDPLLYDLYPVPSRDGPQINSGVVGVAKGRDDGLVQSWKAIARLAATDHELRRLVSWWDQGALNWAARYTGVAHLAVPGSRWNYPARRLLYGLDTLREIDRAHPDAGIVHFAGPDKLGQLLTDSARMVYQPWAATVAVVGLPYTPVAAVAAALAARAPDYSLFCDCTVHDADSAARLASSWPRANCSTVVAHGDGLYRHATVLAAARPGCKFVVVHGDPVELVRRMLESCVHWEGCLHWYPVFMQQAAREAGVLPLSGPPPSDASTLLEAHVSQTESQGEAFLRQIARVPHTDVVYCNAEDLPGSADAVARLSGIPVIASDLRVARVPSSPAVEWSANMVRGREAEIRSRLSTVFGSIDRYLSADVDLTPLAHR